MSFARIAGASRLGRGDHVVFGWDVAGSGVDGLAIVSIGSGLRFVRTYDAAGERESSGEPIASWVEAVLASSHQSRESSNRSAIS